MNQAIKKIIAEKKNKQKPLKILTMLQDDFYSERNNTY